MGIGKKKGWFRNHGGAEPVVNDFIGYYPFNSGSLNDESGNGNHATNVGMSQTTGKDGDANGAYGNDGSSNYMSIPIANTGTEVSYSLWIKPSAINQFTPPIFYTDSSLGIPSESDSIRLNTSEQIAVYTFAGGVKQAISPVGSYGTDWIHIVATYKDSGYAKLYINGTFSVQVSLGTRWKDGDRILVSKDTQSVPNYFNGSVDYIRIYSRELTSSEVTEIYNAEKTSASDSDAQAFVDATGITNSTQITAIDNLVIGLKADSLWSKMKAIYPFVGGTADTHKYNLKDPRDLDAAFRLTYTGSFTHASTGERLNAHGSLYGANTHLNEDTVLTLNDMHLSIYSRTNTSALQADIGCSDGTRESNIFPNFGGKFYPRIHATNSGTSPSLNTQGLFTANRVNGTQVFGYRNGAKYTVSSSSSAKVNADIWLHNFQIGGVSSLRELAFASIGDGLTDADVSNLYTLVQAYQTTLSRQV